MENRLKKICLTLFSIILTLFVSFLFLISNNNVKHNTSSSVSTLDKSHIILANNDNQEVHYNNLLPLESYDAILKINTVEENYANSKYYKLVLKREVVRKLGYETIQKFTGLYPDLIKALDWYLEKDERIEQIIEVGEIFNPEKFLIIICEIYNENIEAFNSSKSLVYVKMSIALGAAYTSDILLSPLSFNATWATYDYIERFNIMKDLYEKGLFMMIPENSREGGFVPNTWFANLHVDLIRNIMAQSMTNAEILWLNGYTHAKNSLHEKMIPYIQPNYQQTKYSNSVNYDKYNNKYMLEKYNIPYGDGKTRLWMVLENGGVCWNQSRFAQNMWKVNGLPAFGAYEPGHEMYYTYFQDANKNGYWTPRYGNWDQSATLWYGGNRYRLIFNWASKSFTDQNITNKRWANSSGYLYLAQANLNNYDTYKKSLYYNLIANSYSDNDKIDIYFKSLEINKYNLDTYDYLLKLYTSLDLAEENWYNLALKVTDSYAFFPVTLYDLLKVIKPHLTSSNKENIEIKEISLIKKDTMISEYTAKSIGAVNSAGAIQTHAKELLGLI